MEIPENNETYRYGPGNRVNFEYQYASGNQIKNDRVPP